MKEFSVDRLPGMKVLVVGDVMLDQYTWGKVNRISPEAPVPVVTVNRKSWVLGGAGNVAANLAGLGVQVILVGVCGDDDAGKRLSRLCEREGIVSHLIVDRQRSTTVKTRVMAMKQQLFRLDSEETCPLVPGIAAAVMEQLKKEINAVDAVVLSDYAKGVLLSPGLCKDVIDLAREHGIPSLVDPKGCQWQRYRGATCITPNIAEFGAVTDGPLTTDEDKLASTMAEVRERYEIQCLLLTRGEKGMGIVDENHPPQFISTAAREVYDVSGAGDTVVSTFAAAIAMGVRPGKAATIANIAAGIVVGKVGTQPVSMDELVAALQVADFSCATVQKSSPSARQTAILVKRWQFQGETVVFTNGCFDLLHPGHIDLLNRARALGDRLVVGLNSDASVSRLKGPHRPIVSEEDRAALLRALSCVDAVVVFDEETPLELLHQLRPDVLVKGADYALDDIVGKELVESYKGRVVRVPLMQGYSTTEIERRIITTRQGKEADMV